MASSHPWRLRIELALLATCIVGALILASTGSAERYLVWDGWVGLVGIFLAGILYTSLFTAPIAVVVLLAYAETQHPLLVAVLGGLGAYVGDEIIFELVRDELSERITRWASNVRWHPISHLWKKTAHVALVALGCVVIATPLPDELGLLLLGSSRIKPVLFAALSISLNTAGILVLALLSANIAGAG